ncbi:nucleoside recognition domain-containing protein [Effusibacillus dendaii]|uniref:Putative membrane protein YvoD n=1 Tax=Effusibacillus dendaii TaxID=2743772 RepID=A0A7I8DG41_9BACL|nr:nucleoside recognition domain-containing protein [Effusibacillus dendaii]BCJ87929.1 putative membrane protein YvoD [Effusibacillus dendaii]
MQWGVWKRGLQAGLKTTWILSKIIVPVTIAVTFLKHTPVISWVVSLFAPVMNWLGLPGEAAIVLAFGYILNLYAAIGAMFVLPLSSYAIFVLAIMLSFCHNLLVETAVAKRMGLSATVVFLIRLSASFGSAVLIRLFAGSGQAAADGKIGQVPLDPYFWQMGLFQFVGELLHQAWSAVWQLAIIVIPLMLAIQILKEIHFLDRLSRIMGPVTKLLGIRMNLSIPLLAGIFFGLAYGAGVILEATQKEHFSKRELYLLVLFLVLCHAVVEDTLLFVPLGVNAWLLLGMRLLAAIGVTACLSRIWRESTLVQKQAIPNGNP